MKIDIKSLPQSKIEITVELGKEEWDEFTKEASAELARGLKVEGFRDGKAPSEIVRQKLGEKAINEKTLEIAIKKSYVRTILDKKIEVIGSPKVEVLKLVPGQQVLFKAQVAVLPEIELADYKKICCSIKKNPQKVEQKEIEDSLSWLQKSRSKFSTVVRPAQKGDRVEVDFQITAVDSDEKNPLFSALSPEAKFSKGSAFILGETRLVPGFEENITGLKEGEEKVFSLILPKEFKPPELAEKLADFKVKMKLVQQRELPEINDNFAASLGDFKNLENLKKSILEGILAEKEQKEKERWRIEIIEKIAEKSKMELSEILIENEIEIMLKELEAVAQRMGLTLEQYLGQIKKSIKDLKESWRDKAEKRVRASLVLKELARQENIEVQDFEVEQKINEDLKHFQGSKEDFKKIDKERLKEYAKGVLKNEKVFVLLEDYYKQVNK